MGIAKEFNRDVSTVLWIELAAAGKFELLDLLSRAERGEVKKVRVRRKLLPNLIMHNTVLKYLEKHGVELIREDITRG